jgi:ADP-ribosylglycohydrolase
MSQTDRIRGVLFGQAVGDALGLFGEFKSAKLLRTIYGAEGPSKYMPVNRTNHGWKAGEWTDDTEQALCILDAYLADGDIDPTTLATNFLRWAHEDGRGMGNHTWSVFSSGYFSLDPLSVSKEIWERSNKRAAPNGGVMRTSVVGILRPQDLAWTELAASKACQVTHFDPRCVGGAVALSVAIACLVEGWAIPDAIEEGLSRGEAFDPDVRRFAMMGLDELQLDEGLDPMRKRAPIGFTHKCMGAGFYALWELDGGSNFDSILRRVIMAGGDTDTNGAVAGACMGAVVGLTGLPTHLVKGLHNRKGLDDRLAALIRKG